MNDCLNIKSILRRPLAVLVCSGLLLLGSPQGWTAQTQNNQPERLPTGSLKNPDDVRTFLESNCYDCHSGSDSEAGFDLEKLADQLTDANSKKWSHVFDRVHDGEMPPVDYAELDSQVRDTFLNSLGVWLSKIQDLQTAELGRVRGRRLTNLQLERTLHDLLGIDIPLANRMPEEPRTGGFTTVAAGQSMSHFQLEQHVNIVDISLDEAFRRALGNPDEWTTKLSAKKIARDSRNRRTREPEFIDGHAVTWTGKLPFYGRIQTTTVRKDGWYRFKIRAKGLKIPQQHDGVWCTIRSGECFSGAPLMAWVGSFEATPEIEEITVEAWLPQNHKLEIRPGDATLKIAKFRGGQVGNGEAGPQNVPGVAIQSIEMQRFHRGPDNTAIQKLLFGELNISKQNASDGKSGAATAGSIVNLENADAAIERLLLRFANRVFRRPVQPQQIQSYVAITKNAFKQNSDFVDALRTGYRAILCSPRFMYFHENPGALDDYAIASRLSYLLWNRMPDAPLMKLADAGRLSKKWALEKQIDRMLADPRGEEFVKDLADQWLDLNLIDFTEPDRRLYPGFDTVVENSMLGETHAYLQTMLNDDLSVSNLIDSDFTFLNSRLARYYGVDKIEGDQLRKVSLAADDPRGGLLTQGAILKVTANGTTTSPVIRGVWVSERILGQPIPPPPENIPAIEPDIRGAKSIREMLAKHKENGECAACHRKIDPPGFALENFDPSGRWRDSYGVSKNKEKRPDGKEIDAGFVMPNGKEFKDLEGFKMLVLDDKKQLARNLVEQLIVYGTGAEIQFADRDDVEECVSRSAKSNYGFQTILKSVITSPLFLSK